MKSGKENLFGKRCANTQLPGGFMKVDIWAKLPKLSKIKEFGNNFEIFYARKAIPNGWLFCGGAFPKVSFRMKSYLEGRRKQPIWK